MRRTLPMFLLLALTACQSCPDRALPPPPLPEKVVPQTYASLLERPRTWGAVASEASYVDDWPRSRTPAKGLEQTAQFLAKADDVPAKHRDTLAMRSNDLRKLAEGLRSPPTAKDVKKTTG